jgi:predicted ATPase
MAETGVIRTPDQRVRVFVSSALQELAAARRAVRDAITGLRLVPVMFEMGARPHPPRNVYRAYLAQSQVFVGIYWQSYGWVAPGERMSGLEDEYQLSAGMPRLIYVKSPAPDREARLAEMLSRIEDSGDVSYQRFSDPEELQSLVQNDLAVLLSERFEMAHARAGQAQETPALALPAPTTPLVGREREAEAASELVLREGVRLVTLTGPGGVGKSRLTLEVARRLESSFADGVRFVDLAPVQRADLVEAAIAAGLGLRTSGGPLIADVKTYLRPRRLVLLLDNFEQVTVAAPLVAELLAAAAGLVVLVTSRTVLRLNGEHEFPVEPLPTPPAGTAGAPPLADLRQYPAVRLFEERAQAAAPGFELTSENAEAVAEICRRLDGLPLAIELAAARSRMLPPQALLARLDDRMSLLTDGARDLPERQRTLRNTLDWSFGLLSPAGQALLSRLGVFPGTFDLEAAEAVGGAHGSAPTGQDQAEEIIDTLGSLVDASLIRAEDWAGRPRFSLLETIRDYARERLRESGQWKEVHDRHAAHFLELAESAGAGLEGPSPAGAGLEGPSEVAWLDRLEAEHDNLGAAISWLLDQDQPGPALQLSAMTWQYWWLRGHTEESARYGEVIVASGERLPAGQLGYAQIGQGVLLILSGDKARAQVLFEQALALFRRLGDKRGIAIATGYLGHLAALRGDYGKARKLLTESLASPQDLGDDVSVALMCNFLGQIPLRQGDNDAAARLFSQGLDAARRVRDRFPLLISLYDLARSSQAREDLAGAAGLLREGLSAASDAGDESTVGYYLQRLAALAMQRDDPDRAVRLLAAADALLQAAGTGWLVAYAATAPSDDDTLPGLRSRMGDATFQQARAQGAAMGRQRAVEYALQE